jgi:hypothetical protein
LYKEIFGEFPPPVAKDLIYLLAALVDIPKRGRVKYRDTEFEYCLLDDIIKAFRENTDKFALLQPTIYENDKITTSVILLHETGYIIESPPFSVVVPPASPKRDKGGNPLPQSESDKIPRPQDVAAITTYARRYALASFLGIAADPDVDGDDPQAEKLPARAAAPPPRTAAAAPPPARDFLAEASEWDFKGRKLGDLGFRELVLSQVEADEPTKKRIIYLLNNKPEILQERGKIQKLKETLSKNGIDYDKNALQAAAKGEGRNAELARMLLCLSPDFA